MVLILAPGSDCWRESKYREEGFARQALLAHERQAAEELAQWKTPVSESRITIDAAPAAISLAMICTREQLEEMRLKAIALEKGSSRPHERFHRTGRHRAAADPEGGCRSPSRAPASPRRNRSLAYHGFLRCVTFALQHAGVKKLDNWK
jgi:hypothetical protein